MKSVRHPHKRLSALLLVSLLGTFGAGSLCASCGAAEMDCCKPSLPQSPSFEKAPCCEFRLSAGSEPQPGRLGSMTIRPTDASALLDATPSPDTARVFSSRRPAYHGRLTDGTSPPLLLLNASLLC